MSRYSNQDLQEMNDAARQGAYRRIAQSGDLPRIFGYDLRHRQPILDMLSRSPLRFSFQLSERGKAALSERGHRKKVPRGRGKNAKVEEVLRLPLKSVEIESRRRWIGEDAFEVGAMEAVYYYNRYVTEAGVEQNILDFGGCKQARVEEEFLPDDTEADITLPDPEPTGDASPETPPE